MLAEVAFGMMLASGTGIDPDIAKGYMWVALAAEQGDAFAKRELDYLVSKVPPRQVADGKRLLGDWKRTHGITLTNEVRPP